MSDVNQIEISADGQDITITVGDYSDADARAAISVVDTGGDGSLTYTTATGVITYTGPSATEVRAHFSAGSGISIANGVITNTRADTNTTYTQNASATTGGANLNLVGSDASTDTVKFANGTNVTVTRTDADTITIASTDTNTTYAISAQDGTAGKKIIRLTGSDASTDDVTLVQGTNVTLTRAGDEITIASADTNTTYTQGVTAATGGANLNLVGTDSTTDTVKFAAGAGITVAETDASTITVTSTITQYTDALARQAISVATNTGDGDLTYNNTNGQFSYTGPGNAEYRAAIGVSNASGDGSLAYSTSTGVITYTGPTNSNYRGAVSAANSGTGYGALSYDTPTGVFTFAKVTGANIRSEVVDGRNLTYTSSTLDLDKTLVSVNSITAETATNLTLTGDELVINTVDVDNASQFLNLNSLGYTYDIPLNTNPVSQKAYATSLGTTSATLKQYILVGDVTLGSNLITNAVLYTEDPSTFGTVVDWTTVTDFVTLPILDFDAGYFDLGVAASSVGSITGTYDPDPGTNTQTATVTLTVRDSAIATTANCQLPTEAGVQFNFAHYIRNSTATNVVFPGISAFTNNWNYGLYRDASNNGYQDGADIAVTYVSYDYTGTQDWQITPRRILNLQPKNTGNEHIRAPFALGVGPGSVMTNRGMLRDTFDAVGININNNGKLTGFTGKTGLNLTQFKNNSFFQTGLPAERCGPNFTFNTFAGNEDTANTALYLTDQDGIGQITWFAQPNTASLTSSTYVPASITVKATETHDTSTKQGAGMYLQYTPNSQGGNSRPRTFLRAEDATVEMLAKTTIKLGKFNNSSSTANRNLSTAASATWATITDTSAAFTVPVQFPVYTKAAAGAITGSMGMQICISDSAGGSNPNGMMAFWDTTNSRWSYVHDNNAL